MENRVSMVTLPHNKKQERLSTYLILGAEAKANI